MPRLRVSAEAAANVEAIAKRIKSDRPAAARRVREKLQKAFRFVAGHPRAGTPCDEYQLGVRVFVPEPPASRYLVFFQHQPTVNIVEVTAVIDGSRDWQSLLAGD